MYANIYLTGDFSSSAVFDTVLLTSNTFSPEVFVAKIGYDIILTGTPTKADPGNLFCFPNPFSISSELRITTPQIKNSVFEMYDVLGKKVKTISIIDPSSTIIPRDDLPSGIYFYKIFDQKETIGTGKLIIE